jgi:shikimate kinase
MIWAKKIVLVGPMGAGKSTIGRLLASHVGLPFKDSDAEIEAKSGADIPWIFDVEGELGFRDRETAVLKELIANSQIVLATGGGLVVREENRLLLKQSADVVVYLKAEPGYLAQRTAKDKKRPLLQVEDPYKKMLSLLAEREPFYLDVATHIIPTDKGSPKAVVQQIIAALRASEH